MSVAGTADRFWAELRALYQAAGQPTLKRLVHLGLEQHPPIAISDSTINGWLNRKAVPTGRKNERYLTAMVAYLQARTGAGTRYQPLLAGGMGQAAARGPGGAGRAQAAGPATTAERADACRRCDREHADRGRRGLRGDGRSWVRKRCSAGTGSWRCWPGW